MKRPDLESLVDAVREFDVRQALRTALAGVVLLVILFFGVALLHALLDLFVFRTAPVLYAHKGRDATAKNAGAPVRVELPGGVVVAVTPGIERALSALSRGEIENAEKEIAAEIAAGGDKASALRLRAILEVHLGREAFRAGKRDEAREHLRKAIADDPNWGDAHFLKGEIAIAEKDFQAAEAEFQLGLKLDEKGPPGFAGLGEVHLAAGRHAEARDAFQNAVFLKPESPEYMLGLARSLSALKDAPAAFLAFDRALALGGETREYLRARVDAAEANERFVDAIAGLRKLAARDANDVESRDRLGMFLLKVGQYKDALEQFKSVAVANPKNPDALFRLGLAHQSLGHTKEVIAAYRKATAMRPNFFEAWLGLAMMNQYLKDYPEASKCAQKALALDPGHLEATQIAAEVSLEVGEIAMALELLKRGIEANPDVADLELLIGQALVLNKDPRSARTHFDRFLALEPGDSPRRAEVESVRQTLE